MVDSVRAKDSPAALFALTAFCGIADIALSPRGSGSGMAKSYLLDMSCSATDCISRLPTFDKTSAAVPDGGARLFVRSGVVSR